MGTSSSKPMEKYTFEKKPVNKLNLAEKELRCTKIELEYVRTPHHQPASCPRVHTPTTHPKRAHPRSERLMRLRVVE